MSYYSSEKIKKVRKQPVMADYHNNTALLKDEVSFHWWDADATSMHIHNYYEFFIITKGKTYHEINGAISTLAEKTLYMIRPSDCHQFRKGNNTSCVHMNFCITAERLEKICAALGISLDSLSEGVSRCAELSADEMSFFVNRARMIGLMARNRPGKQSAVICGIISEAVSIIYQRAILEGMNYPEWFVRLIEKIHSPELLSLSACDIYKIGGYSPPVMVGYFKKFTGKTVAGYLRDVKCNYACELLKDTNLTTLEISTRVGYDSLSHFTRVFKDFAGITPSAYRRAVLVP